MGIQDTQQYVPHPTGKISVHSSESSVPSKLIYTLLQHMHIPTTKPSFIPPLAWELYFSVLNVSKNNTNGKRYNFVQL